MLCQLIRSQGSPGCCLFLVPFVFTVELDAETRAKLQILSRMAFCWCWRRLYDSLLIHMRWFIRIKTSIVFDVRNVYLNNRTATSFHFGWAECYSVPCVRVGIWSMMFRLRGHYDSVHIESMSCMRPESYRFVGAIYEIEAVVNLCPNFFIIIIIMHSRIRA